MNKWMSRDNAQRKGVLRTGFWILTVCEFLQLSLPAVSFLQLSLPAVSFFFTEDKMAVFSHPLVPPKYPFMTSSLFQRLQDRQCKCNVTLRRVFNHCCNGKAVKYYTLLVCICSLRYAACKAHAPYFHPWPVWLYSAFPRCLINGTIFGKTLLNTKIYVLTFFTTFVETFLVLRRNERDVIINVYLSLCKVSDFNETYFLDRFSKNPKMSISFKSVEWKPSCSIRTDRQMWQS
jgi:hypothetical protein